MKSLPSRALVTRDARAAEFYRFDDFRQYPNGNSRRICSKNQGFGVKSPGHTPLHPISPGNMGLNQL